MTAPVLFLCEELELRPQAPDGVPMALVGHLCRRPRVAADVVRRHGASRVVLGLCDERPSRELIGALQGVGVEPFGIEAVILRGHEREAAQLLSAAVAKLARLAPSEHGRPIAADGVMSRRALFSPHAVLRQAPIALLDQRACLGSTRCGLCVARCPVQAIDAAGRFPTVDEWACTACGACVAHCPAGALRLSGSSTAQIEAQLEPLLGRVAGVVFACRSAQAVAPPGWALVEVPTLALLTPAWILQVRARETLVKLAPCDQPCCSDTIQVEALAEVIIAGAGGAHPGPAAPLRLSEPHGTADAVLALVPEDESLTVEHSASPLGLLEVNPERCTLCGACSIACPTSALALDERSTETVLTHEPGACIGCDRCTTVCPENALTVRPGIEVSRLRAGVVEVARAERERCIVCGTDLPPAPMRRRLRALLPQLADAPLDLCTGCASRAGRRE